MDGMTHPAAAHAEALAHAAAELLRYAREGAMTERYPFGLDDIVQLLAEALHFALSTEIAALSEEIERFNLQDDRNERGLHRQLAAALSKWLLDAAGHDTNAAPEAD